MTREELLKIAKPILFNTAMVQAILEGRKSVTRRIIKFPEGTTGRLPESGATDYIYYPGGIKRPPYQVGDILYVRETWAKLTDTKGNSRFVYRATDSYPFGAKYICKFKWKPSIHMPKKIARIFLKVTDVRVERVQDITEAQVIKEGFSSDLDMETDTFYPNGYFFVKTWDNIYKDKGCGWEANPFVWVIEFERVEVKK